MALQSENPRESVTWKMLTRDVRARIEQLGSAVVSVVRSILTDGGYAQGSGDEWRLSRWGEDGRRLESGAFINRTNTVGLGPELTDEPDDAFLHINVGQTGGFRGLKVTSTYDTNDAPAQEIDSSARAGAMTITQRSHSFDPVGDPEPAHTLKLRPTHARALGLDVAPDDASHSKSRGVRSTMPSASNGIAGEFTSNGFGAALAAFGKGAYAAIVSAISGGATTVALLVRDHAGSSALAVQQILKLGTSGRTLLVQSSQTDALPIVDVQRIAGGTGPGVKTPSVQITEGAGPGKVLTSGNGGVDTYEDPNTLVQIDRSCLSWEFELGAIWSPSLGPAGAFSIPFATEVQCSPDWEEDDSGFYRFRPTRDLLNGASSPDPGYWQINVSDLSGTVPAGWPGGFLYLDLVRVDEAASTTKIWNLDAVPLAATGAAQDWKLGGSKGVRFRNDGDEYLYVRLRRSVGGAAVTVSILDACIDGHFARYAGCGECEA